MWHFEWKKTADITPGDRVTIGSAILGGFVVGVLAQALAPHLEGHLALAGLGFIIIFSYIRVKS